VHDALDFEHLPGCGQGAALLGRGREGGRKGGGNVRRAETKTTSRATRRERAEEGGRGGRVGKRKEFL